VLIGSYPAEAGWLTDVKMSAYEFIHLARIIPCPKGTQCYQGAIVLAFRDKKRMFYYKKIHRHEYHKI